MTYSEGKGKSTSIPWPAFEFVDHIEEPYRPVVYEWSLIKAIDHAWLIPFGTVNASGLFVAYNPLTRLDE